MKKVVHLKIVNSLYKNGISEGFKNNDWQVYEYDYGQALRTAGLLGAWQRILNYAEEGIKPDLIFINCNKDGFIFPAEAKALSEIAFTILYTFDVRHENNWIEDVAPHLGLVCFSDQDNVEKFNQKGYRAELMQPSCDMDFYKPIDTTKSYGDIIFIGNKQDSDFPFAQERTEMITFMQNEFGDKFAWYGNGSGNGFLNPEQEREAYSSAKVAITQNQFHNKLYSSDRDFRAMASGCYTVCQWYDEIDVQFQCWKTFAQLRKLCVEGLLNNEVRKSRSEMLRQHVLLNHSWTARVRHLMHHVNKYQNIEA
jgi:hypothetical protein